MISLTTHFAKDFGGSEIPHGDGTIATVLGTLKVVAPAIAKKVITDEGRLSAASLFLNGEYVRVPEENDTPVKSTDDIVLMPTFAGG